MKKKYSKEEHRQGLINLYYDQLENKQDTTFMKAVLNEAIRRLELGRDPKKVENWVVQQDKLTLKF